ncbi:MAG: hypothetical protein IJ679_03015 [Lachnospiraceae bacterium]|nr:hypothetical protein [Lachnospiraceae bacterium]
MDEETFESAIRASRVPVLVLDQKWHRLFALAGKTDEVKEVETKLNELLAKQGKLGEEDRSLKKSKNELMKQIVANMEGADSEKSGEPEKQQLDDARKQLELTNNRLADLQDELLDIAQEIKDANNELMLLTMKFAYEKLRSNTDEINQISAWIGQVRVDLKKNIIKKQNREINNKEMYSYMHDIFGKDVMRMFDAHYDDEGKLILREHYEEEQLEAARVSKD